jgi:hypothetical protein
MPVEESFRMRSDAVVGAIGRSPLFHCNAKCHPVSTAMSQSASIAHPLLIEEPREAHRRELSFAE